jgi:hypothetical protein
MNTKKKYHQVERKNEKKITDEKMQVFFLFSLVFESKREKINNKFAN